jgi:hypothetical protein
LKTIEHVFINGVEHKICGKCKRVLPLQFYTANKQTKDGLYGYCYDCKNVQCRKDYVIHKENKIKYTQEYRIKNHEEFTKRNRESAIKYYWKHREVIIEKHKKYNHENIENIRKKYHKKHPTSIAKITGRKSKMNPEQYEKLRQREIIKEHRRRALKYNALTTLTFEQFNKCLEFFDYKDAYTGLEMDIVSHDHVIPLSESGGFTRQNIIPCEKAINSSKSNKNMEEWYREQSFFSEKRLKKIKQWMGQKNNSNILQIAFF